MKKDGTKIQREYGAWLRAKGPGFQTIKGGIVYSGNIRESASSQNLGSAYGKALEKEKKGQQSSAQPGWPKEHRRKDKGILLEQMEDAVDYRLNCKEKDSYLPKKTCKVVDSNIPTTKVVEKLVEVMKKMISLTRILRLVGLMRWKGWTTWFTTVQIFQHRPGHGLNGKDVQGIWAQMSF